MLRLPWAQRAFSHAFTQFSPCRVRLFATPLTAASQASLSITNSQSSLRLTSIESVMPSNNLILCRPLLLASIFPSTRVFSNESVLHIRWPKYWSFSFSFSHFNEYSGLIDWLDLLAVQGTFKSLLQQRRLQKTSEDFRSIHSSLLSFLYGPAVTSIHDHWIECLLSTYSLKRILPDTIGVTKMPYKALNYYTLILEAHLVLHMLLLFTDSVLCMFSLRWFSLEKLALVEHSWIMTLDISALPESVPWRTATSWGLCHFYGLFSALSLSVIWIADVSYVVTGRCTELTIP